MEDEFRKRINFDGEIKEISVRICREYSVGEFKSNTLITTGYEDFNYILETSKGKFFVKVFANFRPDEDCDRYVEIMEKAEKTRISVPLLIKNSHGDNLTRININEARLRLVLHEFIKGETFFDLNRKASGEEINFLAKQAAMINSMKLNPKLVYDDWAIVNFLQEYDKKASSLSEEDSLLVSPLVDKFKELNIERLPHCFVHGDIISTNVMKEGYKLWIIDFSVSNYYPRIQEIAVLACNLCFNEKHKYKTEGNLKLLLREYQKIVSLTQNELRALPTYIELAHAMYLLSASYEKVVNNNKTKENEYWINQGRMGLKQILE